MDWEIFGLGTRVGCCGGTGAEGSTAAGAYGRPSRRAGGTWVPSRRATGHRASFCQVSAAGVSLSVFDLSLMCQFLADG